VKKSGYKIIIASYFEDEKEAFSSEVDLIARYSPKANITAGGEGASGLKHSDSSKEKLRQSTLKLRADCRWLDNNLSKMREAVKNPESRAVSSRKKKEYFLDEANRLNMSTKQSEFIRNNPEANAERQRLSYEARQNPEHKLLTSIVQGGKDFVVYKDNEFVAEVQIMNEFARNNNLHSSAIHKCLTGKQKEHKGYTFKYKE
jgi:hypothetical protein